MKPHGALELSTPADFCQATLDNALNLIRDAMCQQNLSWGNARSTLYVSIEFDDLIKAIDLSRAYGLHLGLKTRFEQDEWAINVLVVPDLPSEGGVGSIDFWCSGA